MGVFILTGIDILQKSFFRHPPYVQISPFCNQEQRGPSIEMGTLILNGY